MPYVPSRAYYARFRLRGKLIWNSLETLPQRRPTAPERPPPRGSATPPKLTRLWPEAREPWATRRNSLVIASRATTR
jgi:hypothetical protein